MKLGVLTVALGDMSLDAACKFLSEQGVQMVEIGCGGFLERRTATRQSFWRMKISRKSF